MSLERKNSDLVYESGMHFWGITCESGKQYTQVPGERFHLTMAVLDPKFAPIDGKDKTVLLMVRRDQCECLLCVLKHEEIYQVNLNLVFDKEENVLFYIKGHGNISLSGFQLANPERVLNDENRYLCPLVEVTPTKKKLEKENQVEHESITPKSKKKAKKEKEDFVTSEDRKTLNSWNIMSNKSKNGIKVLEFDEESDESDEDFFIGEESSESQESEELDVEELEEELMILKKGGEEDDDEEGDDNEVVEMILEDHSGSRKRKLEKTSPLQGNKVNDKDSSDSDVVALPTIVTPTPKKTMKMESSSENKVSQKKKKKLNECNSSEKSVTGNTPKSTETTPNKIPVVKLEGGVEVQDIIIGKGPIATKGKMVHVFYVGRFANKQIFDSRLPGKKPFSFKLGAQQVIKGWDIGLQGMKVGGKRKLKVPPNMGYGSSKMEGIPPNSTLFFLVELQAVS